MKDYKVDKEKCLMLSEVYGVVRDSLPERLFLTEK